MERSLLSSQKDAAAELSAAAAALTQQAQTIRDLRLLQETAALTGAGAECDRMAVEALHAAVALGAVYAKHYRAAALAYVASKGASP